MTILNQSIVENAAVEWLAELGYALGHEPHIAPDSQAHSEQVMLSARFAGGGSEDGAGAGGVAVRGVV